MKLSPTEARGITKLIERDTRVRMIVTRRITNDDWLRDKISEALHYTRVETFRLGVCIGRARTRQRLPIARRRGAMWPRGEHYDV